MEPDRCRVCDGELYADPLLACVNMPACAQHLPVSESAETDRGTDFAVLECSGCGLVQLDCRPVPYYREVIRASAVSEEMSAFRMKRFGEFVDAHGLRSKKILEVGCGGGEHLSILARCGVRACGLEHSEALVRQCVDGGLHAIQGFVEGTDYVIPGGPFDGFLMLSFLEHLPDPNAVLQGVRNNLSEQGVGIVEVPNFDMILEKGLFTEFMTDHLFYFTRETLNTTLRLNGFEVIACEPVWHDYIISATVAKRRKIDASRFQSRLAALRGQLAAYVQPFTSVAVWGAGHQALALLALSGIANRVKYVVDSAPFKQGKITPVSHIPIVSPDALARDPVEAVLVMAGSYSDEVVRKIRERWDGDFSVAVLRESALQPVQGPALGREV